MTLLIALVLFAAWLGLVSVAHLMNDDRQTASNHNYYPVVRPAVLPLSEQLPDSLDYSALDKGLGIGLNLLENYTGSAAQPLLSRDDWRFYILDQQDSLLEAPGISIYTKQWQIWHWSIDLDYVYTHADALWLRQAVAQAGFTPDLTWTEVTGKPWNSLGCKELRHRNSNAVTTTEGKLYRTYVLVFSNGHLSRIEGALEY